MCWSFNILTLHKHKRDIKYKYTYKSTKLHYVASWREQFLLILAQEAALRACGMECDSYSSQTQRYLAYTLNESESWYYGPSISNWNHDFTDQPERRTFFSAGQISKNWEDDKGSWPAPINRFFTLLKKLKTRKKRALWSLYWKMSLGIDIV